MSDQSQRYQDDLSLNDIINTLTKHKKSIFLMPLLFAAFSLLCSWLFIVPRYQAFATIEVGQVNSKLIEEAAVVEERMKDQSFISSVIANNPNIFRYEKNLANEEVFLRKSLQVKKSKDASNLISFSLLGRSREIAHNKANAVFSTLKVLHDGVFNSNLEMINQQIKLINDQINVLNKDQSFKSRDNGTLNSYNAVVDSLVLQDQVRQLRELQNQKMVLTMSLGPAITYNTRLLGSIWVSQEPVTPDYQMIGLVALVLGFLLALSLAFMHQSPSE